jgi:thiaminase (transcriptional activator TenA)
MQGRAEATWSEALSHRFFREVAADAVEDRVFARYLGIEYAFVDTAAVAPGYAVAEAPSFQGRRRLAFGPYGLVTDQEQFFVDAFAKMGLPATTLLDRSSQPLHNLFLSVTKSEGYDEILTCTLAAECMYLTRCSAGRSPNAPLWAPFRRPTSLRRAARLRRRSRTPLIATRDLRNFLRE